MLAAKRNYLDSTGISRLILGSNEKTLLTSELDIKPHFFISINIILFLELKTCFCFRAVH